MGLAGHQTNARPSVTSSQTARAQSTVRVTTHATPRVSLVSNKNVEADETAEIDTDVAQESVTSNNNILRTILWFGIGAVAIVFIGVMTLIIFQPRPSQAEADFKREMFYQQWR